MHVFRARGFEAAGLAELVEAMGIGRKSMYDTFGNKRALFIQAIEKYASSDLEELKAKLDQSGSPLKNICAALDWFAKQHGRPHSLGCGVGNSVADFGPDDPEMSQLLRGHLERTREIWAKALTRAVQAGELPADTNTNNLARLIVCTAQGIALVGRVAGDTQLPTGAARGLLSLLRS